MMPNNDFRGRLVMPSHLVIKRQFNAQFSPGGQDVARKAREAYECGDFEEFEILGAKLEAIEQDCKCFFWVRKD